jgi:hypothetical protein
MALRPVSAQVVKTKDLAPEDTIVVCVRSFCESDLLFTPQCLTLEVSWAQLVPGKAP